MQFCSIHKGKKKEQEFNQGWEVGGGGVAREEVQILNANDKTV